MVFFIPLRVVAEESGAAVRGRRWSSGDRSERRCGRCGATGSTAPTALIESRVDWVCGVLSLRHFRLARWCSLSLCGWSPKNLARRFGADDGARAIGATDDAAAVELPGRRRRQP